MNASAAKFRDQGHEGATGNTARMEIRNGHHTDRPRPLYHHQARRCWQASTCSVKMIAVDLWQGQGAGAVLSEKGCIWRHAVASSAPPCRTAKYIVDKGPDRQAPVLPRAISRDYGIYAEFLTHLAKKGAGIGFDMGGYLTALAAILGGRSVAAFTRRMTPTASTPASWRRGLQPERATMCRCRAIISAAMTVCANGVLGTLRELRLHGTRACLNLARGILTWATGTSSARRPPAEAAVAVVEFPFTHGYQENSRSRRAAEIAWSSWPDAITARARRRAASASCSPRSPDPRRPLPAGYRSVGDWSRKEESALI